MDADDVAQYLKQNPKFFEDYADVIADIFVPHPHGGHAIPIAERQIVTLREKNTELENRLREMIRFGSDNDQISERLHRSTLALDRRARSRDHARRALPQPQGRFRRAARELPPLGQGAGAVVSSRARGDEPGASRLCRQARRTVLRPGRAVRIARLVRCRTGLQVVRLPAAAHRVHVRPPRAGADASAERFHSGMGTVYLTRLAELASVATSRYLPPA